MSDWVPVAGALLAALALLDVFLTVLYARSGAGLFAPLLYKGNWRLFRLVSTPFGRSRAAILAFAGPFSLVVLAAAWVGLIVVGFALLYWPELGSGVKKSLGPTPTDFVTALYYSGFSLTTLGIGDLAPSSSFTRILTVLEAGIGFSLFTLTITYFLSVYRALQRRNTFASILHHKTSATGDARAYIVSIMAGGNMLSASEDLSDSASRVADLLEAHTFYPVLHYFHFHHLRYAIPRMALILLDSSSLIKSLHLPGGARLESSASQLETATFDLLERMAEVFLGRHKLQRFTPRAQELDDWRGHYRQTVQELRKTGVSLPDDTQDGETLYLNLRRRWHPYIGAFSASLGYELEEVVDASH